LRYYNKFAAGIDTDSKAGTIKKIACHIKNAVIQNKFPET